MVKPHNFKSTVRSPIDSARAVGWDQEAFDSTPLGGSDVYRKTRQQLLRALLVLAGVLAGGTFGLQWLEGWTLWRAFFFTLITIATIGYGDYGISHTGEIFTVIILVVGITTFSYAFALVVQIMVTRPLAWRKRMQAEIDKLRGHAIVAGYGRIGSTVCEQLDLADVPFVIVEQNHHALQRALEKGFLIIEGSASQDEILTKAGIKYAAYVVSGVDSEAENIVITLSARQMSPGVKIIARAERNEDVRKLKLAGADCIVSPFQSGGQEIANAIVRPKIAELMNRRDAHGAGEFALAEIALSASSPLIGLTSSNYAQSGCPHVAMVALARPGESFRTPPPPDEIFVPGDLLIVAGHPKEIAAVQNFALAAPTQKRATSAIQRLVNRAANQTAADASPTRANTP